MRDIHTETHTTQKARKINKIREGMRIKKAIELFIYLRVVSLKIRSVISATQRR
jgi:hypothetical protein